jgi:hypothetical protein
MNGRGISAIVGTIMLVATVVAMAAVCYVLVQTQQEKQECARSMDMWISNYTVTENGAVQIEFGFLNNNSKIDASITINVEEIRIVDRMETSSQTKFTKIVNITIDEGNTKKLIAEPTELEKNKTYRVDISMTTEYRQYPIRSLYVFAE